MSTTTFKGARYVVKFGGEWSSANSYEALVAVLNEGSTYLSKQPVPKNIQLSNSDYWLLWADPNAQMEQLRQTVEQYEEMVLTDNARIFVFNTVNDMKESENLSNGSVCKTLGFYSINDGGSAYYVINNQGIANEMDIISCGNLNAHLILPNVVTPEIYGAKGDGITDDSEIFKYIISHTLSVDSNVTTWEMMRELQLGSKTYFIDSSIVDVDSTPYPSRLYIKGNGNRSAIVCGENCSKLIDNNNLIAFTIFEDLFIIGYNHENTFMHTRGANPQSMKFIRCTFHKFHTAFLIEGSADNSEFVFEMCKFSGCGTQDSPSELFVFNNSQAVNWRFYATEIEANHGVVFKLKQGTSIYYYQGSIIPLSGCVFDYNNADSNTFGYGNLPTATMFGVRYELRDSSQLISSVASGSKFIAIDHYNCGMGGYNQTTSNKTIECVNDKVRMNFYNCWNLTKYTIDHQISSSFTPVPSFYSFNGGDPTEIEGIYNRSTISASSTSYATQLPIILRNGAIFSKTIKASLRTPGTDIQLTACSLDQEGASSNNTGVKRNLPRSGFLNQIYFGVIKASGYGNTAQMGFELYDDSDNLVASDMQTINAAGNGEFIQVNRNVNTDWYFLFKHTYGSSDQSLYIEHVIYGLFL